MEAFLSIQRVWSPQDVSACIKNTPKLVREFILAQLSNLKARDLV